MAVEPIVDAQRKADLLRQLAEQEGLCLEQTIAVGDGANDLPMLGLAGLGVALRAKPLVKQSAKQAISTLAWTASSICWASATARVRSDAHGRAANGAPGQHKGRQGLIATFSTPSR